MYNPYINKIRVYTSDLEHCDTVSKLTVLSYVRSVLHASDDPGAFVTLPMQRLALVVGRAASTIKTAAKDLTTAGVLELRYRGHFIDAHPIAPLDQECSFYTVNLPVCEGEGEFTDDVELFVLGAVRTLTPYLKRHQKIGYVGLYNAAVYLESWVPAKRRRIQRALNWLESQGYLEKKECYTSTVRKTYAYKLVAWNADQALNVVVARARKNDPKLDAMLKETEENTKKSKKPKKEKRNDPEDSVSNLPVAWDEEITGEPDEDGFWYDDHKQPSPEEIAEERKRDALAALDTPTGKAAIEAHKTNGTPLPRWVVSAMEDAGIAKDPSRPDYGPAAEGNMSVAAFFAKYTPDAEELKKIRDAWSKNSDEK